MYSFAVPIRENLPESRLGRGTFLWVIHADKIPPHIGVSVDGSYYSLKVSGKDTAIPAERMLSLLRKKNIATLFFQTSPQEDPDRIRTVFEAYDRARPGVSTCLDPVTKFYLPSAPNLILAELLHQLQEMNAIEKVFGLNLADDFAGIPLYGRDDIQHRLTVLNHAKRTKSISESH